ncbi:MAG: 2,3-bisphosphoglycerate-independent phosphoglycerate mutase [Pseudomonadota bacterium]
MGKVNLLVILDGFGHRTDTHANAIAQAHTPTWDRLQAERAHTLISGSGLDVGLPAGQMGNSEVGHMNLGAGRVVYQDFTRINRAIEQNEFNKNHALSRALRKAKNEDAALHVFGLLSPGGVHSHEDQIHALLTMAAETGVERIYLHAFLDGRDTPPQSAAASIERTEQLLRSLGRGQIASICGRYFAMDRDNRWDRVERAYNLIVRGEAPFHAASAAAALADAYQREETDEFVQPTAIHDLSEPPVRMHDNDVAVFMNFRADRARQLCRALLHEDFDGFERRSTLTFGDFVTLTQYASDIESSCAFAPMTLANSFGEHLANLGKTQLRIAETEKYAHVTFFFSGGREEPFAGEERILVPSPDVATYDLAPEMSAVEVTDKLVDAIVNERFDGIICNYANGDMVGHTGNLKAAIKAVETLDACLERLVQAIEQVNGQMLITADHGNCEQMLDPSSGQAHTAHTSEPVPLLYVGERSIAFDGGGTLADVAPTLLSIMDITVPKEMTGRSLLREDSRRRA